MNQRTRKSINERIAMIDRSLVHAEQYVAKKINVEGLAWLHLDDWQGKSGHPKWVRNRMIPVCVKSRKRWEPVLERIEGKENDKHKTKRKRRAEGSADREPIMETR